MIADVSKIIGISFGPDDKCAIRGRLMKAFDRFFDVSTRSNADVARLLRDLRVHIAVDLKGHTTDARMGILAQGAAPIQVNYMGFPGTTGADFIDYVIADAIVAPTEHEQFFSERIVHLPQTYLVDDINRHMGAVPTRRDLGLPETAFVFCCFNNAWKINPRIFDVWARLLGNVDGSVLWLYRSNELAITNLKREAYARGIDPDRLNIRAIYGCCGPSGAAYLCRSGPRHAPLQCSHHGKRCAVGRRPGRDLHRR